MNRYQIGIVVGAGVLLASVGVYAAAPAGAPAGSTGLCNDGTYYQGPTKKGACKGHQGVREWYGAPAAGSAPTPVAATPATPTPAATPAPAAPPPAASAVPKSPVATTSPPTPAAKAAAGGGAGKVWVNKSTKVYHCSGDRWYGKTKEGEYMSEAQAKAQGFKAAHDKACS